jgi:hypothetical protein
MKDFGQNMPDKKIGSLGFRFFYVQKLRGHHTRKSFGFELFSLGFGDQKKLRFVSFFP